MIALAPITLLTGVALLDAVRMPAKDLYEAVALIVGTPILFALGLVVFFKLLNRFSTKAVEKGSNL